jgi:hypothetical protein
MSLRAYFSWILVISAVLSFPYALHASADEKGGASDPPKLVRALMCERIEGYMPVHHAVVFSIDVGQISCYTSFDNVRKTTHTLHKWYRRDTLITSKRLTLKSPSWSTYSSIQLRQADKGPWRVEIYNANTKLLKTLRFSVTD